MKRGIPMELRPTQRFPEFIGQKLHDVRLGEVTEESTARNGSRLPPASVMGVRKEDGIVQMEGRLVAADISRYKLVGSNWFAYNPMRLNIGSIARWQGDSVVLVSPDYVVFRCLEQSTPAALHPEYLDHFRRSSQWDAFVNEAGDGGVRVRIYYRDISQLRLIVPDVVEQQKIADCLGSLDDLIAAEGRKLEALRQHKQGLMQHLFPQPGETVPRLRFPEFEDAPEWESRELGLMTSKIGSGVTPRGGEKNYRSSGRPFVRSQNVGWGELILDNVVHIDEDTHASFAATEVEEGDVLLNISGASIGRSAVADARIGGGNVNQHVCIIRGLSEQIQAWFLSQYLISKHGQDQIDSCQAGGNRQGLNFGQIRSFLIPQPRDVAEQERIADCLRAADIIRATHAQRISALKRQKQGLLQQLFPSLETE